MGSGNLLLCTTGVLMGCVLLGPTQIIGGNMLRVFEQVETVAKERQAMEPPYEDFINPTPASGCRNAPL